MLPTLDVELQEHLAAGPFGPEIHHPLLHTIVFDHSDESVDMLNTLFRSKREQTQQAIAKGQWDRAIAMYEKPYRPAALLEFTDKIAGDDMFWQLLGSTWIQSEFNNTERETWLELFATQRPGQNFMMNSEEQELLLGLPKQVTLYRGTKDPNETTGMSWTLSPDVAEYFAGRFDTEGHILEREIPTKDIMSVFTRRDEQEVLLPVE